MLWNVPILLRIKKNPWDQEKSIFKSNKRNALFLNEYDKKISQLETKMLGTGPLQWI